MKRVNDLQKWLKEYRSKGKRPLKQPSRGERHKCAYGTLWYRNGFYSSDWYEKDDSGKISRRRKKLSSDKETAIQILRDFKEGKIDEGLRGQPSTRVGTWGQLMAGAELIRMGWEIFFSPFFNSHTCDVVALKSDIILRIEVKANNQAEQYIPSSIYKSKADVFAFVTKQDGVIFNQPMEKI